MEDLETIVLNSCRHCPHRVTPYITFSPTSSSPLEPLNEIKIMLGIPPAVFPYKAISHVWGDVKPVTMQCRGCSNKSTIKLKSKHTFDSIMSLAGPGSAIWMDNISIDQDDPKDVAEQVAAMGTIYERAEAVAVMLPPEDAEAYHQLSQLREICDFVLRHREYFEHDEQRGPREDGLYPMISEKVQQFFATLGTLRETTGTAKYWSRAWTFQEWALARELDIGLETEHPDIPQHSTLKGVKCAVIDVAILVISYKLRYHQYAGVDVGFSRGSGPVMLDQVKRLFPSETKFLSDTERDWEEVKNQMYFTSFGNNDQVLGIRPPEQSTSRTPNEVFLARLAAMLNTFRGGSTRKATFEADMVACWASMCNIDYGYDRDDKLPVAIAKVVRALRKRGVKVYNFHSRGTTSPDADAEFFRYSFVHASSNSENGELIFGIPFMTGRMDTCIHLAASITTDPDEWALPKATTEGGFKVARVKGFRLVIEPLQNKRDALGIISVASSGRPNMIHGDAIGAIAALLERVPDGVLLAHVIIGAAIPMAPGSSKAFAAWTVIPAPVLLQLQDGWDIFVGREDLNGTLVVAASREQGPAGDIEPATIVLGYLAITDHTCGSFLVPSTPEGKIFLTLDNTGGNSSAMDTSSFGKRALETELDFCVATTDEAEASSSISSPEFRLGPGNNQTVLKELESAESRRSNLRDLIRRRWEGIL